MATALFLASPLFHPSQSREFGGATISKFNSSFYGNLIGHGTRIHRDINHSCCTNRSITITSLLGRRAIVKRETVVPDPDYRIPIVLLGASGGLVYSNNLVAAVPVGLLGLLLLVQEVKVGSELKESGENVFVGGKNRWKYSTFVNWELWWPNFPILVYFKETQTKPEGQIHFFPVIFNGKQLYDVMVERAGPSQISAPKAT